MKTTTLEMRILAVVLCFFIATVFTIFSNGAVSSPLGLLIASSIAH